jgi:hypothetical protein
MNDRALNEKVIQGLLDFIYQSYVPGIHACHGESHPLFSACSSY